MKILKPLFVSLFFIFALFFLFKNPSQYLENTKNLNKYKYSFSTMSTEANVVLYCDNKNKADKGFKIVENKFEEIVSICNVYNENSEISKINKNAHLAKIKLSNSLVELLNISRKFFHLSNESFDITAGPLIKLWGFYKKRKELPIFQDIIDAKLNIGFDNIVLQNKTILFKKKGIKIDFGGIAKGFAIDKAIEELKKNGFNSGFINLGGNIRTLSSLPKDKKYYTIGIKNPKNKKQILGTVQIKNNSISTSGNYERYVNIKNKKYTHIINPKTGLPIEGMLSVTVITPLAVEADALSTSIFINGADYAKKIAKEFKNTSILIISEKNGIINTVKIGDIWNNIQDLTE